MKITLQRLGIILVAVCIWPLNTLAAESVKFQVKDIRIEGLQRLPVERVYAVLPVSKGDYMDNQTVAEIVRRLYSSGDFEDVQVGREGDQLVVVLSERPAIARLDIKGNKSIDEKQLKAGLKDAGLAEGEMFRRSTLEGVTGELQRQYVAQGRYDAHVETEAIPLPRNRVAIDIKIYEGSSARIRDINIVGNKQFDEKELRSVFELKPKGWWPISGRSRYSRERLSGDLEALRSHYLDRGYINFSVESTQVAVTPDRNSVYITINVDEGQRYNVGEIKFAGDIPIDEALLEPLVMIESGEVFSQRKVTYSTDLLSRRLGNEGYTFAEVHDYAAVNEETGEVDIVLYVDSGRKNYVRKINFTGNAKTHDEVIRRELRQFEGAPANTALIDLSRERLQRLGFFSHVETETPKVSDADDMVDVEFSVEEQPSGSIGANVGYSDASGFIFGANVSQNNFMGTGNRVSFGLSRSDIRESYNFSYLNPYYTLDGVSRGISLYYSKIDFKKAYVASYAADRLGATLHYGYPISEYSRLDFGVGVDNIKLKTGPWVAVDINDFLTKKGRDFDLFKGEMGLYTSTLNRGIMPDRGWSSSIGLELAAPGSDYTFYKVNLEGQYYFPITDKWTLRASADVGYGSGYGDEKMLPFFENYYSGGIGSVRGYRARSLGPRSPALNLEEVCWDDPTSCQQDRDPDPMGGNLLVESSLELIFPTPFAAESRSLRTFLFVDAGQTFQTGVKSSDYKSSETWSGRYNSFDVNDLRYSAGVGLTWLTAIGPLGFSLGRPLNKKPGDESEFFQFTLGHVF